MFQGCSSLNYIKALFTTTPSSDYTYFWVNGVAPKGTFVKSVAATWNVTGDDGVPTGWTVKVETPGPGQWMDNPDNYLRFKFVTDGQVKWQNVKGDIQYSKNGGAWTAFNGATVSMSAGDEIWFKGDLTGGVGASSEGSASKFITAGKFYASGNVQSLCSFNNTLQEYHFANLFKGCAGLNIDYETSLNLSATTLANNCYSSMFSGCTSLTAAPELPATTLAERCYGSMFNGCTSLTAAPELPATTLANGCYYSMFYGCTSLTAAPELPATTLVNECYGNMFKGCASLTAAPELPATTLAVFCYAEMFSGCVSLTAAPDLPVTTLANGCYYSMFYGCTSLTAAPELPATTLAGFCYFSMFNGCTSLTAAPELPATTLANDCYFNMFNSCTSLTSAPALPATTLVNNCYSGMFQGCSSLNYIKALFTTTPSSSYTRNWVSGVATTGTFVKADAATWNVTGNDGVPTGWTAYTESTDPTSPIPGEFSVSATKKVKFSKGNLQAVIGGGPTDTYNYSASNWKFAGHQYDIIGNSAGNTSFALGTTVDLFGWVGASASYDSYGLCTNTSAINAYYGTSGSIFPSTSEELKTDWGSIPGVVSSCGSGWRTLTKTEWNYLFTQRTNASSLYGHCQITTESGTVTGMLILPDNWAKPSNCAVTPGTGGFDRVTYEATAASGASNAWCDMEAAGAVFLPAAGCRRGVGVEYAGSDGYYWSSSFSDDESGARCAMFWSGTLNPQGSRARFSGSSVRLVKDKD